MAKVGEPVPAYTVRPYNGGFGEFNDYKWWVGQDGNIWANIAGVGVKNLGSRYDPNVVYNESNAGLTVRALNSDDYDDGTLSVGTLSNLNRINDPNPGGVSNDPENKLNATGDATVNNQQSAEDAAVKRRMIGIYDREIQDLNSSLDSLGGELENTLAGVKGQYDQYANEQQSAYDAAQNDYNNSTKQNQQNLQTNRNEITNRASSGLRGLLRVLGALGAGGGSVARYEAPAMVLNQANQEYSNAGKTYAQNQQSLDTDWGNYLNDFDNDKRKLEDWYNGQVKSKTQENYEKGQSLLSSLVAAYGNRAQYGGDYGNNIDNTYNRMDDYRSKINELGQYAPANYTGKTAVYNAPDLATYDTGNTNLQTAVTNSTTSAASPLLVALQGLNKRKTNTPYSNNTEA